MSISTEFFFFPQKILASIPKGGHDKRDLWNSFKIHADLKDTDILMLFNFKEKKIYLDLFSSRSGCLFSKYCTGNFSRSNLLPAKGELSQHLHADINASLEEAKGEPTGSRAACHSGALL